MGTLRQLRDRRPECYFEARFMILDTSCRKCTYYARCFEKTRKVREEERERLYQQLEIENQIAKMELDKSWEEIKKEVEKRAEKRKKNGNITDVKK